MEVPLLGLGLIFLPRGDSCRDESLISNGYSVGASIRGGRRNLEARFYRTRAQDYCGIAQDSLHVRLLRMTSGMRSRVIRRRI